jgi:TolB-like protein
MTETPILISELRSDCPPSIARLVMQCLEKDVARRPASAREILQGLDQVTTPLGGESAIARRRMLSAAVIGGVLIGAIVIAFAIRTGATSTATPASVAVLPFANVGGDSAQAYLADGMSDELTTALGKVPGVQVVARSRTYNYRNRRDVDAREAGRTLGVAYVVQGTVRRAGDNRLHVSAQLTSAADGKEVWSEIYDKDAAGLFEMQDAMTRSITAKLASPAQQRASQSVAVEARGTKDIVAHDLYQRGQFLLERRGPGVRQSVEKFQQAIERDSLYARAYAGLSEALAFLPYFSATPAPTVDGRAEAAARRALSLDSTLSAPHIALALAHAHSWRWDSAGIEFRRAIAADSLNPSARTQYGRYLLYTGHFPDARAEFERGRAIDPYSSVSSSWLAVSLWFLGERAGSIAEFKRALELDSTSNVANNLAADAYIDWGNLDEARRLGNHMPRVSAFTAFVAWIHGKTGDREMPLRLAHELEAHALPRGWFEEWSIAMSYLSVGDTVRGLDALERSVTPGEIWPDFVPLSMPLYDPVRANPRFAAIVRKIGLDVVQATQPRGGRK